LTRDGLAFASDFTSIGMDRGPPRSIARSAEGGGGTRRRPADSIASARTTSASEPRWSGGVRTGPTLVLVACCATIQQEPLEPRCPLRDRTTSLGPAPRRKAILVMKT